MGRFAVTLLAALALVSGGCGDDDDSAEESSTTSVEEESTAPSPDEGAEPAEGSFDPLALVEAAGPAGDQIHDASIEKGILVLRLQGDPSDVDMDEISDACSAMREATGAQGVETETRDGERTSVCFGRRSSP